MATAKPRAEPPKPETPQPRGRHPDWSKDIDILGIWVPHTHMLQNAATSVTVGGRVQAGRIEGIVKRMVLLVNGNVRCDVVQGADPRGSNPGKWRHVVFTPPFYAEVAELEE